MKTLKLPDGVKPLGVNPPTVGGFITAAAEQKEQEWKQELYTLFEQQGSDSAHARALAESLSPRDEDYEWIERCASLYVGPRVTHKLEVICGECLDERGRYSRESIAHVRRFPGSANVPAMWIDGDVWTERICCYSPVGQPHRVVYLDRRVQAALETQIMGTPRKRISLVAIEKIANSLTDEQVYSILHDGVYRPTKS